MTPGTAANGDVVQSLWIGPRLSTMERLSIRSFLDHGHAVDLFTYGEVEGVPPGTNVLSGEDVLPAQDIFRYRQGPGQGSVAAFSNCFRYRLLLERGGWWSDLDVVCLGRLEFGAEHVVAHERSPSAGVLVGTALFRAPAGSPLMEYCWRESAAVDRSTVTWGQIGPHLLTRAVATVGVPELVLAPEAFFPVDFWQVWRLVLDREVPAGSHALHLWNSQWRQHRLDPDAIYDSASIYELLKRRHGVRPPRGAPRGPGWRSLALRWSRLVKAGLESRLRGTPAVSSRVGGGRKRRATSANPSGAG